MSMNRRYFLHSAAAATMCLSAGGCGKQPQERDEEPDPTKSGLFTAKLVARAELPERHFPLAVSPDGKTALTGGDRFLRFWSLPDAKPVKKIPAVRAESKGGAVWDVAYFPDGKRVMALVADNELFRMGIWDIETGTEVPQTCNSAWMFALSSSGNLMALLSGGIQVWDLSRAKQLHLIRVDGSDIGRPNALSFSPDEKWLAVGFQEKGFPGKGTDPNPSPLVRMWEVETGKEVLREWKSVSGMQTVAFSPDSKLLAAGCGHGGPAIQIWDAASGNMVRSLSVGTEGVYDLSFHPKGRMLASGGRDNLIQLWAIRKGELLDELKGHTEGVYRVRFTSGGTHLVSAGYDRQLLVWELEQK